MIIIPGWLIALLTFPGVIVHEAAHQLFCKLRGVAVFDVCYFRPAQNPSGYVIHEPPRDFLTSFLVATGPLFVNTLLCLLICFPAFVPVRVFHKAGPIEYVLLWLGVSIGMHAFPSTHDAKNLLEHARSAARRLNVLAFLSFPLIVLIYLANIGSIVWLDYLYGLAIGLGLPELLIRHLA